MYIYRDITSFMKFENPDMALMQDITKISRLTLDFWIFKISQASEIDIFGFFCKHI